MSWVGQDLIPNSGSFILEERAFFVVCGGGLNAVQTHYDQGVGSGGSILNLP